MTIKARLLAAALLCVAIPATAEPELLMFEETYCEWCDLWDEEIGVAYAKTTEGKRAPLVRLNIHEELPRRYSLDRRAHYTPTFVLVDRGREVGRIEGYAGEHFFYPMLERLLQRLPPQTDDKERTDENPES